jgi:hypothetical protein
MGKQIKHNRSLQLSSTGPVQKHTHTHINKTGKTVLHIALHKITNGASRLARLRNVRSDDPLIALSELGIITGHCGHKY